MGERFKNLIGGKWVEAANGGTFDDVNPANKADLTGSFPRSDHRDIDGAVEVAKANFAEWSRTSPRQRGDILYNAARLLEDRAGNLAGLIVRDTGKVLAEAHTEVREGVAALRAIASEATRVGGAMVPVERLDSLTLAVPVPLGVAAVITHWLFPLAGCVSTVGAVLAAGNTVILKPAEDAPLVTTRLVELLLEAGLPAEVIGVVHGYGEEAGAPLVRHPDVALVCFTGSSEVGREVAIACAAERKRLSLNLGERNVAIVLEDADVDLAVEGAIIGGFAAAGQRWLGAVRLLVQRKVVKEFSERIIARAQAVRLGDGMAPTTDVGPLINEAQLKRVHGHTRIGLREGAKLLHGGEVVKEGDCKRGFFYAPTIFGDTTLKMRLVQEEIPGPTLVILPVTSVDDALEQVNSVRHEVTTTVYTRDVARAFRVVEGLWAGRVLVNPTPAPHAPWASLTSSSQLSRIRRNAIPDGFWMWKEASMGSLGKR